VTSATADVRPIRSLADAEGYVALICFKHGPPELAGVELEWTVHHRDRPDRPLDGAHLVRALGPHAPATLTSTVGTPLEQGSLVTVEPGGQVELSSRPCSSLSSLIDSVGRDRAALDSLLGSTGLVRGTTGLDPFRPPRRLLDVPRYAAMQAYFDRIGPHGSVMMCSTASTQVCLDAGTGADLAARWRALHVAGPALVALFANSPAAAGRRTGWASSRLRATLGSCPPHTHPAPLDRDPTEAWVERAMTAPVLCVRRPGRRWDAPVAMSFAEWVRGAAGPPPTYDDLDYHLSTLFPPVRPRGYLEVRYLDAQPDAVWHHPLVVLAALLSSPAATEQSLTAAEATSDRWLTAARSGLGSGDLRESARRLLDVAATHVRATGLTADVADPVLAELDRRISTSATREVPV
jgi:glutamate--cysteine ligase